MLTYLSKYSPNLSQKVMPSRDLLSMKNEWFWDKCQQDAFDQIKHELSNTPILAVYDPSKETIISAEASSYELRAVLRQKASKSSVKTSRICLYITNPNRTEVRPDRKSARCDWACERFSDYTSEGSISISTCNWLILNYRQQDFEIQIHDIRRKQKEHVSLPINTAATFTLQLFFLLRQQVTSVLSSLVILVV